MQGSRTKRLSGFAAMVLASVLCVSDVPRLVLTAFGDPLNLFSLTGISGGGADEGDLDSVTATSILIQRGEGNLARLVSLGPVQALVSQFGQNNTVQLRQDGEGLVSVVEQGRIPGTNSVFETELAQRASPVDPFAGVSGNRAFIDQTGINNRSIVGQFGIGGQVDVVQGGQGNLSSIFQPGNDAVAFVSQAGQRNGSILIQNDFAVRASVVQTGTDGLSEARQWDQSSGSIAQVFQAGSRNLSDIDQAGVRNLATVVQWDLSDRAASTVIQDGNLGQVRVDQAGSDLVSIVRQATGEENQSDVFQGGSGHISEISQSGVRNMASVKQSGAGNRSVISQSGSGNVATVQQSPL